jgi:hypothetical protein
MVSVEAQVQENSTVMSYFPALLQHEQFIIIDVNSYFLVLSQHTQLMLSYFLVLLQHEQFISS